MKDSRRTRLVIFDCDGVMFDSREANRHYYNRLLAEFGHPPMDEDEVDYVHVHNVFDSVAHIFRNHGDDLDQVHRFRGELGYDGYLQYMRMEPDLVEFLEFLTPERKAAISTNRTNTMIPILETFGLSRYFGKVMTPLDLANPKPHPEAIHRILEHFGMDGADAVYIGDSGVDEEHAQRAGVSFIAFRNPGLAADFHVRSFSEIMELPLFG